MATNQPVQFQSGFEVACERCGIAGQVNAFVIIQNIVCRR
jgi:hypothetical protein